MNTTFNAHMAEHAAQQRRRRVQKLMILSKKKQQKWLQDIDAATDTCLVYSFNNPVIGNDSANIYSEENEIFKSMMSLLEESMKKQDTIIERIRERVEEKYKTRSFEFNPHNMEATEKQTCEKENLFIILFNSLILTVILLIFRTLLLNAAIAFCQ